MAKDLASCLKVLSTGYDASGGEVKRLAEADSIIQAEAYPAERGLTVCPTEAVVADGRSVGYERRHRLSFVGRSTSPLSMSSQGDIP